ncbi:hypothetical protein [Bradyrhizobium sp. SZCCHNRI2007]|uniref:hypothetical protein n=1 Tax=Bradyrhizobium sp. SZCCHNRI2007 TaxID=3057281 RepID=UPI0028E72FF8|nr:hypothetical protein [Bradyrhizobium sp. SZCCHNRI2007]
MRRPIRHCNRLPSSPSRLAAQPTVPAFIDTALTPPRTTLVADQLVWRMAEDMREAAAFGSGITEQDLLGRGFTVAQIKLHGDDARALAQRLAGPSL